MQHYVYDQYRGPISRTILILCMLQVRGRDLPGAVKVVPEGLGAALAKRRVA